MRKGTILLCSERHLHTGRPQQKQTYINKYKWIPSRIYTLSISRIYTHLYLQALRRILGTPEGKFCSRKIISCYVGYTCVYVCVHAGMYVCFEHQKISAL
jgi:hypothetical protein